MTNTVLSWVRVMTAGILTGAITAASANIVLAGFLVIAPEVIFSTENLVIGAVSGFFYGIVCSLNSLDFLKSALWCGFLKFCLTITLLTLAYKLNPEGHTWQGDLSYNIPSILVNSVLAACAGYAVSLLARIWNEECARPRVKQRHNDAPRTRPEYYKL